jgi:drug/metabolite transporter (DMT)-like permease
LSADHPLRRALPLILFAGLCFASLDAAAKYLVLSHGLLLVVWARYAGQMVVSTPIAWSRGGHGFWRIRHLRIQLIRSLCLVTATICFFGGLRFLPLAEASAITFLAPMFPGDTPRSALITCLRRVNTYGGAARLTPTYRPNTIVQ